jgi:hypothetical protein
MGKRILDALERSKSWKIYRHGTAAFSLLKGLLQAFGVWPKVVAVAVLAMSAAVGFIAELPIWEKLLVGLTAAALLSMISLAIAAAVKLPGLDQNLDTPREDEAVAQPRSIVLRRSMVAIVVVCIVGMILGGWLMIFRWNRGQPRSRQLTEQEMSIMRISHENELLRYGNLQQSLVKVYLEANEVMTKVCRKLKLSDEQIRSGCRTDLEKGIAYAVPTPEHDNGCFDYDPSKLYATNKVHTLFSIGEYAVLSERNWPVAFESLQDANIFIAIARNYHRACFVGGVQQPSLSDALIEWPGAKNISAAALCEAFTPDDLMAIEETDASYVLDGNKKLLRFANISDANAAVGTAKHHSTICVIGGIPGVNAPHPNIVGWESVPGNRVVYLN